jgi:hypothetical protein
MKTASAINLLIIFFMAAICVLPGSAAANTKIAVLDFELRDLTLLPGIPAEKQRTASVKPLLEAELKKSGYEIVAIPLAAQIEATSGFGYLFDHHDVAAQLGQKYQADYVLVGRLHKPSFLFVYLMGHLIDVKKQVLFADFTSEVKGGDKKLTGKGVEDLAVKITNALNGLK